MNETTTRDTRTGPSGPAGLYPASFIDLARYPLGRLGSPEGARLVAESRSKLHRTGVCLMPGFVRPEARLRMAADAQALEPSAWYFRDAHNAWLEPSDGAFPGDHPRRRPQPSSVGSVPCDRVPADSPLRHLYAWDPLREFVGAVMGVPRLHRLEDSLGAFYVNVYHEGDHDGWHFDETEYTTLLMLQAPEAGGVHEYVPDFLDGGAVDYEALDRVLEDRSNEVSKLVYGPGDLVIYAGRRSLHRVTAVQGRRARLVAVFCFDTRAGKANSETVRRMFWGRAD